MDARIIRQPSESVCDIGFLAGLLISCYLFELGKLCTGIPWSGLGSVIIWRLSNSSARTFGLSSLRSRLTTWKPITGWVYWSEIKSCYYIYVYIRSGGLKVCGIASGYLCVARYQISLAWTHVSWSIPWWKFKWRELCGLSWKQGSRSNEHASLFPVWDY